MSWLGSLASLVPLQCLWGKLQNPSFLKLSFARQDANRLVTAVRNGSKSCLFSVSTSILCGRRNRSAPSRNFRVHFVVARGAFWRYPSAFFVARRSTFDVSCCESCCESHCQRCPKCYKVQSSTGTYFVQVV